MHVTNKIVLLTLLLINSIGNTSIISKHCGPYDYLVEITRALDSKNTKIELYNKIDVQKPFLFYKVKETSSLKAYCIQNKKGEYLFLFNEINGENPVPEDMFGIFDPKTNKLLIKPIDWPIGNKHQVEKIIGFSPMNLKDLFCCQKEQIEQSDK